MWRYLGEAEDDEDKQCKRCRFFDKRQTAVKLIQTLVSYCQLFISMILCEYGTNAIQGTFTWDKIPKLMFYMLFIFQLYDSKVFSIVIQHFIRLIIMTIITIVQSCRKKGTPADWRSLGFDIYIFI